MLFEIYIYIYIYIYRERERGQDMEKKATIILNKKKILK
jgi:hypothetical protein